MNPPRRSTLVLALGNDILADDGVAFVAARRLAEGPDARGVDVRESGEAGLNLLDLLAGYRRALLIDSIVTGRHPPGTVLEFSREDFTEVLGPSPHYAGLPEILELAKYLSIPLPDDIRVLAMEIEEPWQFREGLNPAIEQAVPHLVAEARQILRQWRQPDESLPSPAAERLPS